MPTPRQSVGYAVDPIQPRVFVVGGNAVSIMSHYQAGDAQLALPTVESFDTRTQNWTGWPDLPHGMFAPGAAVVNNTLYVIGGTNRHLDQVANVWALPLNQPNATWVAKAGLSIGLGGFSVAVLNTTIYVLGGVNHDDLGDHYYKNTRVYNVQEDSWSTRAAAMDTAVVFAGASPTPNASILLFGGRTDSAEYAITNALQMYQPGTDTFQTVSALYGQRSCLEAAQLSDQFIIVAGGYGVGTTAEASGGNNILRDVDMYDLVSQQWSTRAPLPLPRAAGAAVVV